MKESIQTTLILIVAITIVLAIIMLFLQKSPTQPIQLVYKTTPLANSAATTTPAIVIVDIEGAIQNPGVYTLPAGSRVEDGINTAGGFTEQADLTRLTISRASILRDEQRIYVPQKIENTTQISTTNSLNEIDSTGKININVATKEQLETLNGIGEKTAQKIIQRRETKGNFTSIEQLVEENIMYQSNFEKVQEDITV